MKEKTANILFSISMSLLVLITAICVASFMDGINYIAYFLSAWLIVMITWCIKERFK